LYLLAVSITLQLGLAHVQSLRWQQAVVHVAY
jgi:hypothetical protein